MGCVTATAKRRRKQAVNGLKHLNRMGRPVYRAHTSETYDKREAAKREKRIAMQGRKRKGN